MPLQHRSGAGASACRRLLSCVLAALLFAGAAPAAAQVSFAGDARIRPRLDLDDRTGDPTKGYESTRLYYMYRLRLDMTAAIGGGYALKTRLGHNGIAYYGRAGRGQLPDVLGEENTTSDDTGRRVSLDLMYLYMTRATEHFGFDAGLIPVPGFANPLWDLHYYPDLMVDIPYFLYSTDGGFGVRAYVDAGPGRLQGWALLDRPTGEVRENGADVTLRDGNNQYTLAASYALPIAGFTLEPMVFKALSASIEESPGGVVDSARSGSFNAPLTVGAALTFPRVAGLVPALWAGWSRSDVAGSLDAPMPAYRAWLGRAKLTGDIGPGRLTAWLDVGRRTDELAGGDIATDYANVWLNYAFTVYRGERGSFSIGPEWRIIDVSRGDDTLRRRHKLEINFDAAFR